MWSTSASGYVATVLLSLEQSLRSPLEIHISEWLVLERAFEARQRERRKMNG